MKAKVTGKSNTKVIKLSSFKVKSEFYFKEKGKSALKKQQKR